jgi:hypothetical protein
MESPLEDIAFFKHQASRKMQKVHFPPKIPEKVVIPSAMGKKAKHPLPPEDG